MWIPKSIEIAGRNSCATLAGAIEILSPLGNGHHPGETPGGGKAGETRSFAPVPGPGGRLAGLARLGDWPAWLGGADEGLLHLIHGGGPRLCLPHRVTMESDGVFAART